MSEIKVGDLVKVIETQWLPYRWEESGLTSDSIYQISQIDDGHVALKMPDGWGWENPDGPGWAWWIHKKYVTLHSAESAPRKLNLPDGNQCIKCKDFVYMAAPGDNFICRACHQDPWRCSPLTAEGA